jgi:hypothetical protein
MLVRKQQLLLTIFATSIGICLISNINAISSQSATSSKSLIKKSSGTLKDKDIHHFNTKILFSQNTTDKQLMKDQKTLEKEIRKEEKNVEKEAKKNCSIAYSSKEGKKNKCDPSVEDEMYPGVKMEPSEEEKSKMVEELQKDIKDKSVKNIIVK